MRPPSATSRSYAMSTRTTALSYGNIIVVREPKCGIPADETASCGAGRTQCPRVALALCSACPASFLAKKSIKTPRTIWLVETGRDLPSSLTMRPRLPLLALLDPSPSPFPLLLRPSLLRLATSLQSAGFFAATTTRTHPRLQARPTTTTRPCPRQRRSSGGRFRSRSQSIFEADRVLLYASRVLLPRRKVLASSSSRAR